MKLIISWNCQGLTKPKAIRAFRLLLKNTKPDVLFLCEVKTLLSPTISKALNSHSLHNISFVPHIGTAGSLLLAWTNNISLNVSVTNNNFIHSSITIDPNSSPWHFTCYCPCYYASKALFWNNISGLNPTFSGPWMLIGDFNCITSQSEKNW